MKYRTQINLLTIMVFEEENALRITSFMETNQTLVMTNRTHRIRWYDATVKDLRVFRIPIEFLTYNFENMRIEGQLIEEINKIGNDLDFEEESDREIYTGIFEETLQQGSDKTKTSRLKKSIANTQQDTPAIISYGGIILDGNRRFMVLKQLFNEESIKSDGIPDRFKYMEVVRLDVGISKSQLLAIQTLNQLFEEDRVDYTLINQALAVRKLRTAGYDRLAIAKMFNIDSTDIEEFEEVLNLIDFFLEENELKKRYTIIDKRKIYDHFKELRILMKGYGRFSGLQGSVLDQEKELMRKLAFKWLKNNIDPQMINEKKVMRSREVIRRLKNIVHTRELRTTVERVINLGENVDEKRQVHSLMTAAVNSSREGEREERVYSIAIQITDKLENIQRIINEEESEIDKDRLLRIMNENQNKFNSIIQTLNDISED